MKIHPILDTLKNKDISYTFNSYRRIIYTNIESDLT